MNKLIIMTVIGTRPEIIRLSEVIKKLDSIDSIDHILVHTGQNYDFELNEIFFEDLNLRKPDFYLNAALDSASKTIGQILINIDNLMRDIKPSWFLVLGDTNSALAAISAKKNRIPILHLEAGNRSFDENVPEEINRRLLDHISDFNMPYTEHSRRNLISEGIKTDRIFLSGSPLREVITKNYDRLTQSNVLERLNLDKEKYILMSFHRDENVENPNHLEQIVHTILNLRDSFDLPIVISTHPRTAKKSIIQELSNQRGIYLLKPFGYIDYLNLQVNSFIVLSDSGSISEESVIVGFDAINIRYSHERPETFETGIIPLAGLVAEDIIRAIRILKKKPNRIEKDYAYTIDNFSDRVVNVLISNLNCKS